MNRVVLLLVASVALWLLAGQQSLIAQSLPDITELKRRSAAIKPTADELKWQQIPWQTDLTEGLESARLENRPIFLWVTGDEPLQRC